jgi:hypothetical protein
MIDAPGILDRFVEAAAVADVAYAVSGRAAFAIHRTDLVAAPRVIDILWVGPDLRALLASASARDLVPMALEPYGPEVPVTLMGRWGDTEIDLIVAVTPLEEAATLAAVSVRSGSGNTLRVVPPTHLALLNLAARNVRRG